MRKVWGKNVGKFQENLGKMMLGKWEKSKNHEKSGKRKVDKC